MNELYHHGILGQRKGRRRFQNYDGTLTPEGKIRYAKRRHHYENGSESSAKKVNPRSEAKKMTDEELKKKIERLRNEKDYVQLYDQLNPKKQSAVKKYLKDAGGQLAREVTNRAITKLVSSVFGDNNKDGNKNLSNIITEVSDSVDLSSLTDSQLQAYANRVANLTKILDNRKKMKN